MTRADQARYALLLADERAVWDAHAQQLITPGPERVPMSADEAIVLYGMALRYVIGCVPITT